MRPAARRTVLVRARRTVLVRKVVSDESGPLDSAGNQRLLATPLLSWPVDTFLQDVHCLGIELATDNKKEAISSHFLLPPGRNLGFHYPVALRGRYAYMHTVRCASFRRRNKKNPLFKIAG